MELHPHRPASATATDQPRAQVPRITDPADPSPLRLDPHWRPAANDGELTPEDVDAEVRRLEADMHNARLKDAGVLEQRRVEFAYRMDPLARLREQGLL